MRPCEVAPVLSPHEVSSVLFPIGHQVAPLGGSFLGGYRQRLQIDEVAEQRGVASAVVIGSVRDQRIREILCDDREIGHPAPFPVASGEFLAALFGFPVPRTQREHWRNKRPPERTRRLLPWCRVPPVAYFVVGSRNLEVILALCSFLAPRTGLLLGGIHVRPYPTPASATERAALH